LVESALDLPVGAFDYASWSRREIEARKRTFRLAPWLTGNHAAFRQAYLAHTSYELSGPTTSVMAGTTPAWISGIDGGGLPMSAFATPVRGIWCIEAARLPQAEISRHAGVPGRVRLGETFADALLGPVRN
jgi:hypothetical protein